MKYWHLKDKILSKLGNDFFFFVLFSVILCSFFFASHTLFLVSSQQTTLFAVIDLLEKRDWNLGVLFFLGQRWHAIVLSVAENASSNLCMP